jgi:hypothetical protein
MSYKLGFIVNRASIISTSNLTTECRVNQKADFKDVELTCDFTIVAMATAVKDAVCTRSGVGVPTL